MRYLRESAETNYNSNIFQISSVFYSISQISGSKIFEPARSGPRRCVCARRGNGRSATWAREKTGGGGRAVLTVTSTTKAACDCCADVDALAELVGLSSGRAEELASGAGHAVCFCRLLAERPISTGHISLYSILLCPYQCIQSSKFDNVAELADCSAFPHHCIASTEVFRVRRYGYKIFSDGVAARRSDLPDLKPVSSCLIIRCVRLSEDSGSSQSAVF